MKILNLFVSMCAATAMANADSIYDIPLKDIDEKSTSLKEHKGKAMLIVNVASECGFTSQYEELQAVYQKYKDKGFTVLGFPCNQFGGQEPGTNKEIKAFCTSKYQVTFPMYDKIDVKGPKQHPLYKLLTDPKSDFSGDVGWNFTKFLVDKDGKVIARFSSREAPDSTSVVSAIEKAMAKK